MGEGERMGAAGGPQDSGVCGPTLAVLSPRGWPLLASHIQRLLLGTSLGQVALDIPKMLQEGGGCMVEATKQLGKGGADPEKPSSGGRGTGHWSDTGRGEESLRVRFHWGQDLGSPRLSSGPPSPALHRYSTAPKPTQGRAETAAPCRLSAASPGSNGSSWDLFPGQRAVAPWLSCPIGCEPERQQLHSPTLPLGRRRRHMGAWRPPGGALELNPGGKPWGNYECLNYGG